MHIFYLAVGVILIAFVCYKVYKSAPLEHQDWYEHEQHKRADKWYSDEDE